MSQIATQSANLFGLDAEQVWDIKSAFESLQSQGVAESRRTAERYINSLQILPRVLDEHQLLDEYKRPVNSLVMDWAVTHARKRRERVLFVQLCNLPNGKACLHANDARGARFWVPMPSGSQQDIYRAISQLRVHIDRVITLFAHGNLVKTVKKMPQIEGVRTYIQVYQPQIDASIKAQLANKTRPELSPHLKRLEAESIEIIREAVAEAQNPAMLYSVGKDSGVMLHLARKAFYPASPPFPLLHVDTRWKFQEMYQFRDYMAQLSGMKLLVHTNPEAIEKDINPFDHGSALHTDITKTEGLKQALDHYKFDVIFGGARRDEEKSRAKERIFSFRTPTHMWDPKNQRPELWSLYNTRKNHGESIRVFPLSNWTEMDIWQYIYCENIPMVPLYFAKERPVLVRDDMIMLVDDDRCQTLPNEEIQMLNVRFRTLGCYPLTGAVESDATTIEEILLEVINARQSERQGRKIDTDSSGSMEKKKQEGYF